MNELLAELFSSRVRAAVLGHLLPRPQVALSLTEFSRILDLPISSLQHECYKLERIGVIKGRREGNSRRYRVDSSCRVLSELTALVVAALGQEESVRATLGDVPGLEAAFIGRTLPIDEIHEHEISSATPIPLVLIGEIPLEEIDSALDRVATLLNLPTSKFEAVFYRPGDWRARLDQQSQYAVWLVSGRRSDLVGDPLSVTAGPAQ
ncbi:MAG: winged helix-turn-helix domain-containing protein [Chloroflexota bacterium]|nr:winged helix-turn-helix domain-containing protein [Chloroflexota bacterium]